jgi:hypothetical protein
VGGGVDVSVVHDTAPARTVTIDKTSARRCCTGHGGRFSLASQMPQKRMIRIDVASGGNRHPPPISRIKN